MEGFPPIQGHFCSDGGHGGLTLIQDDIDTGNAQPIETRPCRLPLANQASADSAVEEMPALSSNSPWASGVVMVNKKRSQKIRFCVDDRPLNSAIKKDLYLLP